MSRGATIAIVVIVIIIIIAAGYAALSLGRNTTTSSPSGTSISTNTGPLTSSAITSSGSSLAGPQNNSQLIVQENEPPNSFDPAAGFFAGEDEVLVNTYQELVIFNYTSLQQFAPILAQNWTVASNYSTYSFTLRNDANFANGHPFNASAVWFNFYRVILMGQIGAFYFTNLLYNGTSAFATGFSVPNGLDNALVANGYVLSTTNATLRAQQAANDLAAILNKFNLSNSTIQSIMSYPHQAVVVKGQYSVTFNLVNPYLNFLQVVSVPGAGQVDPAFVDANGGVAANTPNTYVNTHSMGTAPYIVKSYVQGQVLTMVANPSYWATKLSQNSSNIMLTPPKISVVIIEYSTAATQLIQSITSNSASLIGPSTIPALTPNYLPSLAATPGLAVHSLSNAPKFLFLESVMDTEQYPYNITNFRLAIVHAINYSEISTSVGNGYTAPYVGPISPGYPYYNPANLPPYSFDPANSTRLLAALGFQLSLPNGTTINPGGKTVQLSITYTSDDPAEVKIAQEMQIMFANVGLTYKLNAVTTQAEESAISQSGTASSYPGMLIWYWFPSWSDAVYQDLVVQTNVVYGGISGDVSWFNNTQVNNLTLTLPFFTNPSQINQTVTQVYNLVYQQAPVAWLYAIDPYWVQRNYVAGIFNNAGILGFYYPLIYYNVTVSY